jgi:hypothetical protein
MPLTPTRPFNEAHICESTTSIATTPVVAAGIAPVAGYVQRVMAAAGGTTTGTTTVAVAINGGSDIAGGALTIAAGTGARAGTTVELALQGAGTTSGVFVNEGDCITFTPSGGTGASIPGAFALVIRALA